MKYWSYIVLFAFTSCNNQQQNIGSKGTFDAAKVSTQTDIKNQSTKEICWTGTLNGKTPVFIHYQLDSNLIIGEITYLNTKDKLPITLLGTIEDEQTYRLLEFDKTGNITGVIEGKPTGNGFRGTWVSPKTEKELTISLFPKDTLIASPNIKPEGNQIHGNYHYQYGENGYKGDLVINKLGNDKIDFIIHSFTNVERGPNIAEVEKDTITMTGNSFIYSIPGSESCEFKVIFYKEFAYINYTKGYCNGQFGLNATIDGIFIRTQ